MYEKGILKLKSFNTKSHGKEVIIYSAINTWNSLQKQLNHFQLRNLSTFQLFGASLSESLSTLIHVSCFMLI